MLRWIARNLVFRKGGVFRIWGGPLRGHRFRVGPAQGWAPILGKWEPEMQRVFCRFISAGTVVYDLGANTGLHSLLASHLTGHDGVVLAFEPVQDNIDAALDLFMLNSVKNIRVVPRAVAAFPGKAQFMVGENQKQGSLIGTGTEVGREILVDVTTIDEERANGSPPPDFVKIDVEGAEGSVLEGYSRFLGNDWPVLAIELHSPEQDLLVGSTLAGMGFRLYRIGDETARRVTGQTRLLCPIEHPDRSWPHPAGVWGAILAVHPSRLEVAAIADEIAGGTIR